MNAALAPEPGLENRQVVVACLHAALDALEADDHAAWRARVDELVQWRTQPLVQGLAKLARELDQALGQGGAAGNGSLPEACARLEHVVRMCEDASHHTLDLIQECGALVSELGDDARIAAIRSRLSEMTAAQGYQDLTGQIIRRVVELVRAVHAGLGEITDSEATPIHLNHNNRGYGPSVAGVDPTPATQEDANDLLSSLGL